MIPLSEINAAVDRFKVSAETIEKDYVICWILTCLSKSKLKQDFIFYGGTAIKRLYFEEHCFSEDIDLISTKTFDQNYLNEHLINALGDAREKANLAMEMDSARVLSDGSRTQMFIRYSGYDEIIGAPKEIRLDFAMGMTLYGEAKERNILESYSDLKNRKGSFPVQTLNTILAGKLGLLMESTRKEPRDLFDIWFLLNRLDQFDFNFNRVQEFFKQNYGYYPSLSVLKPHLQNRSYKERWETRLKKQIADLPAIDSIIKDTETRLKKLTWKSRDDPSDRHSPVA